MKKSYALLSLIFLIFLSCSDDNRPEAMLLPSADRFLPVDNSTDQPLDVTLRWNHPGEEASAVTFDLYLGTSIDELALLDSGLQFDVDRIVDADEGINYQLGALELNMQYYWKVITRMGNSSSESEVLRFTTTDQLPQIEFGEETVNIHPGIFQYQHQDSLIYYIGKENIGALSWIDGQFNTDVLVENAAKYPKDGLVISAKYCKDLDAYGYDDWYLPSIVELDSIDAKFNLTQDVDDNFWSSTEHSQTGLFAYAITYLESSDLDTLSYIIYNTRENLKCKCVRRE